MRAECSLPVEDYFQRNPTTFKLFKHNQNSQSDISTFPFIPSHYSFIFTVFPKLSHSIRDMICTIH